MITRLPFELPHCVGGLRSATGRTATPSLLNFRKAPGATNDCLSQVCDEPPPSGSVIDRNRRKRGRRNTSCSSLSSSGDTVTSSRPPRAARSSAAECPPAEMKTLVSRMTVKRSTGLAHASDGADFLDCQRHRFFLAQLGATPKPVEHRWRRKPSLGRTDCSAHAEPQMRSTSGLARNFLAG